MPKPTSKPAQKTGTSFKDRFRNQKQDLMKRHQEQVDSKDSGTKYPTIFDDEKIPKGIEFWRCKPGEHLIDIIPFFAGSQHPKVKEGELAYVVDLWVHVGVGAMNIPYPCTNRNFKETDPICEYISQNRLPTEDWKRISPKRRTAYLVWVHDSPEEEKKGLQIWEVAHFYFEEKIDEIAKSPRGGGAVAFSDIESGKSIAFTVKKVGTYKDAKGTDRDSIGYLGHRFVDRDIDVIPERILEQSFSLDEVIKMKPDYDEMAEAFHGKNRNSEPEEDDTDFPVQPLESVKPSNKKKPKPEPEPEEEDDDTTDDEETDDEDQDDSSEEEDQSDDDDDSSDEEVCPHDPDSFGECDEHPECEEDGGCPLWDACSDEAEKRKKEKKKLESQGTKLLKDAKKKKR